jgi:hypothetical protein
VRPGTSTVEVFFALDSCSESEAELIEEIELDMSASGLPDFDVVATSWVGSDVGPEWPGYGLRYVFRRMN